LLVSDKSVNVVVVDASQYQLSEEYFQEHVGHYMQMILDRSRLGVILTVFTKVDLLCVTRDRVAIGQHYAQCVKAMLQLREQQRKQQIQIKYQDTQLTRKNFLFLSHQNVEVREEVLFVSSLTLEGLDKLYKRLEEVTSTATLLPRLEAEVPETWLAFEDRLHFSAEVALGVKEKPKALLFEHNKVIETGRDLVVSNSSPIPVWSVKSVTSYGVKCGLSKDEVQSVLLYLHQVSSLLYFHLYPSLRFSVFGLVSFVIDVLKMIFHHEHEKSLQYDMRFLHHPIAVSSEEFMKMKADLIHNACLAMPMLLALWSDFKLQAHHLDVFLKLLIDFEFAYILADSKTEQTARQLCSASYFEDDQSDAKQSDLETSPFQSENRIMEDKDKHLKSGGSLCHTDKPISCLLLLNAKLLIPWLLVDEKPDDLGDTWLIACPTTTVEVTTKFSFVYSIPHGVFERLSCRCHQHSSFIRHWRSGFLMKYGCIKILALTDDNKKQVTMTARAPDAGRNLYRLFHVLWRCINEMENVLATLPGVLLDRYIILKKGISSVVGQQRKTYHVASSGILYDVDDCGQLKKVLELPPSPGIQSGT
jgi:hypothetical protein